MSNPTTNSVITFMEREIETYLNGGLYRNTCLKLNIFAKDVKKNFMRGSVKKENSAHRYVGLNKYTEFLQKKEKQGKNSNVNIAKKIFMFLDGKKKQVGENTAHKNVIGKTNQRNIQEKKTHNTKTDELKKMGTFMFRLNGEKCENGYMNEIITNVKSAESTAENYMPTILFQLENAKTHSENQILSRCVESATNNITVLNNRTGGENEFFK